MTRNGSSLVEQADVLPYFPNIHADTWDYWRFGTKAVGEERSARRGT